MKLKKTLLGLLILSCGTVFGQKTMDYDKIVLRIGSQAITNNEIELMILRLGNASPNASADDLKRQAIEQLVGETLLDNQTQVLNIQVSNDDLQMSYQRIKDENRLDETGIEEALKTQGQTVASFKRGLLRQLKRQRLVEQEITAKIVVSEQEIQEIYDQLPADQPSYRTRHILRSVKPDADAETVQEALKTSQWLAEQLKSGGDFGELATKYSEDPSAQTNLGDLGFFTIQDLVKPYSDAMSALPLNTVSEPIRSQFGFHLIEVLEVKKPKKPALEEIKLNLQAQAKNKKTDARLKGYFKKLLEETNIIVQDKDFDPNLLPKY